MYLQFLYQASWIQPDTGEKLQDLGIQWKADVNMFLVLVVQISA